MDKYVVIKYKDGRIAWHEHTKEFYPNCEIITTTNCEYECVNLCFEENCKKWDVTMVDHETIETANCLGIKITDINDLERAAMMSCYNWKIRLN